MQNNSSATNTYLTIENTKEKFIQRDRKSVVFQLILRGLRSWRCRPPCAPAPASTVCWGTGTGADRRPQGAWYRRRGALRLLPRKGDNGNFMQLARVEENKVFVNGEKQVLERFCEKDGHNAGRFRLGGLEYWCQQEFLVFPHLLGGGILEHSLASSCSCHIPQT